ncbi:MAG: hypothetical protein N2Z21_09165 [Candidatus Sumerlaeaceae bacterium]|nr:hypothetical protein [Candidatus Sumerlaeaceae bacterium]
MRKLTLCATICAVASSLAFGGTPTIDGTFDGESVWGSAVATNSNPGFSGAGATATALYVTDDSNYVYFGAQVSGLAGWMSFGFAIDARSGGSNSQDTWARQINFAFPSAGDFDAPEFVVRGNVNNSWTERHEWTGSSWTGFGTNINLSGDAAANASNGFVECRIAKSVLNMRSSKQGRVEFYLSGDQNAHGLFTSVPYDTPCTDWNPSTPQQLTNPASPVMLPVSLSSFAVE